VPLQLLAHDSAAMQRRGWSFMATGAVLVLFGVAVLAWPELTGTVLVLLIGALILAAGLVLLWGSWRLREVVGQLWIASLLPALAVTVFGILVLAFPDAVSTVLLVIVAVLVVVAGLGALASAFALSAVFRWWWLRLLRGALLVGAGVWAIFSDLSGLVAIGAVLGVWSLVLGVITVAFGLLALRA
jgi:uncharacterized membrane protein HdeD (DUF308 family)